MKPFPSIDGRDRPPIAGWRASVVALAPLLCFCGVARAQPQESSPPSVGACVPRALIERSDLVLLGIHGGMATGTPYVWPDSDGEAAEVVAVAGHLSRPTFLILAAHKATVWDLSGLTGLPPAGIYVSGYYSQGVTGVAADVPIVFRHSASRHGTNPDAERSPCPDLHSPHTRPEAMSAAIRIRRAFGKWPNEFYGSNEPFSFRIGGGPLPPYAPVPDPHSVRAEAPLVPGDSRVQRNFARNNELSPENEAFRAEERQVALRGRRLLHIRWNSRGDIVALEPELFGDDEGREQSSE